MTLSFDPDTPDLPLYHCIGGERVQTDGALEMRRPSDGKRYGACPVADLVDSVVQTAKQSLRTSGWADVRPRERVVALQRWTDLIQKEALTLGRPEAVSTARPIAQLVGTDIKVIAEQMPIARPTAWPYTRDISGAVRIAKALQAGTDGVNRYGRTRHHILPTSGYKHPAQGSRAGSVPRQSQIQERAY